MVMLSRCTLRWLLATESTITASRSLRQLPSLPRSARGRAPSLEYIFYENSHLISLGFFFSPVCNISLQKLLQQSCCRKIKHVIKALRTHPHLSYISCNPESLVANAIELCTPYVDKTEKVNNNNRGWRNMSSAGLARHRAKLMPNSEPFQPIKAMAVDLFPHTLHCELVMLLERLIPTHCKTIQHTLL